jgi:uncharacterized protein (DUF2147 family)
MTKLFRTVLAGGLALGLGCSSGMAAEFSPKGLWESATGESRYQVDLCGNGTQLCAKAVWLRKDARTPENVQYLGTYMVDKANHVQPNQWKGSVNFLGHTLGGKITLTKADRMSIEGCLLVFCKSFGLVKIAAK